MRSFLLPCVVNTASERTEIKNRIAATQIKVVAEPVLAVPLPCVVEEVVVVTDFGVVAVVVVVTVVAFVVSPS